MQHVGTSVRAVTGGGAICCAWYIGPLHFFGMDTLQTASTCQCKIETAQHVSTVHFLQTHGQGPSTMCIHKTLLSSKQW